ncbi:response regulator [Paenibacillus harenae]|uniref:response regulator n=1 Tax=Paenibacillus harenae TaxID=306543 RepID=UPI002791FED0|nr:response regulator [Paenibacillus harenae]MDQ0062306.1 two-component system response regulator YesN [Paenibacillus harenae]
MYKLLIVDDEALVREAIQEGMNWEAMGLVCMGTCEDGVEALEFIDREKPDIVMTDIGMPFMNGIELTRELSVRYPDVKVIILTGYDEFEYAQQALKMKVADYIMKPVTAVEMEEILLRIAGQMDMENKHKKDYERLKHQLNESMPLLKERFLERLVASSMTEKQRRESSDYFGIAWGGDFAVELAIDVDELELKLPPTPSDDELFRFAIYNITKEVMEKYTGAEVFRDRENRVLVLLSGSDPEVLGEAAGMAAERIHAAITAYLPLQASIGIGHACKREDNMAIAHRSALSALVYRFVIGTNEIIRITDMERREKPAMLSAVVWENELITKLKTGTPQDMDEWIGRLFSTFRNQFFALDVCYIYLQRFVLTLMHTLYEMGTDTDAVFGAAGNPIAEMGQLASLNDIESWMKELCGRSVTAIRSMREDHSMLQIDKAKAYVRRHYMDPELSLKTVCRHVSMSASYFSTLFKTHMGKTFVEYVIHERMEKAKELLKLTNMRSYEIAYAVGYSDPQYFSSAFKKHTGDTPTEFRGRMTAGGEG